LLLDKNVLHESCSLGTNYDHKNLISDEKENENNPKALQEPLLRQMNPIPVKHSTPVEIISVYSIVVEVFPF
jgi:hypothetical protein